MIVFIYVCLFNNPCPSRCRDVVDELWKKTSSNWIIVTGSHLAAFFDRYALKQKSKFNIIPYM